MKVKELVKSFDPENLFDVLVKTFTQAEYSSAVKIKGSLPDSAGINNVIITGLGGSAIAGDLFKNIFSKELQVPVSVNRNYHLPAYAGKQTLLIASSYSGSTEETLSAFEDAVSRGCTVICISTGGELVRRAESRSIPVFELKKGFQPRFSLGLSFFALVSIFSQMKLIADKSQFTAETIRLWKEMGDELSSDSNRALTMAVSLLGTVPMIYGVSDFTDAIAIRIKSQFNENSKIHSFSNAFPELNHNEIIGWETHQSGGVNASVIILNDPDYHPQVHKRIAITADLIRGAGAEVFFAEGHQKSYPLRMMELVYFLDWVTYYFALLRGKDPGEIDYIHLLKKKLSE
ncbi:MAG: bifunctional phosphoglucose/phosphomannose isomerase [Ignavibacteriales bacterium]|nr:MAG: bifunctional phosphoglucose/phosphomannose isomerase [Ignavibacteriales bacterium]